MLMVAQVESNWNLILSELSRWKELTKGGTLATYLPRHIRTYDQRFI
jgi:hypothetical protein